MGKRGWHGPLPLAVLYKQVVFHVHDHVKKNYVANASTVVQIHPLRTLRRFRPLGTSRLVPSRRSHRSKSTERSGASRLGHLHSLRIALVRET